MSDNNEYFQEIEEHPIQKYVQYITTLIAPNENAVPSIATSLYEKMFNQTYGEDREEALEKLGDIIGNAVYDWLNLVRFGFFVHLGGNIPLQKVLKPYYEYIAERDVTKRFTPTVSLRDQTGFNKGVDILDKLADSTLYENGLLDATDFFKSLATFNLEYHKIPMSYFADDYTVNVGACRCTNTANCITTKPLGRAFIREMNMLKVYALWLGRLSTVPVEDHKLDELLDLTWQPEIGSVALPIFHRSTTDDIITFDVPKFSLDDDAKPVKNAEISTPAMASNENYDGTQVTMETRSLEYNSLNIWFEMFKIIFQANAYFRKVAQNEVVDVESSDIEEQFDISDQLETIQKYIDSTTAAYDDPKEAAVAIRSYLSNLLVCFPFAAPASVNCLYERVKTEYTKDCSWFVNRWLPFQMKNGKTI